MVTEQRLKNKNNKASSRFLKLKIKRWLRHLFISNFKIFENLLIHFYVGMNESINERKKMYVSMYTPTKVRSPSLVDIRFDRISAHILLWLTFHT